MARDRRGPRVRGTIFVNAARRPRDVPRGNQYLELCVFRHVSPAMPASSGPPRSSPSPWGMCPRAAGEACMGLQGYSGP